MIDISKIKENNILYLVNKSDYGNEILTIKVDHIEDILTLNNKGEKVKHKGIVGTFTDEKGFEIESYVDNNLYGDNIFNEKKEAEEKLMEIEKNKK